MCKQHQKPSIKDFFTNLNTPIPLDRKISLLRRNNAIKIIKQQGNLHTTG